MEGEFRVGLRRYVACVAIAVVIDPRGAAGPVGYDATGMPVVVVARVGIRGEQPEGVVFVVDDAPQAAAAAKVGEGGEAGDVRGDEAQRRAPGRECRRGCAGRDGGEAEAGQARWELQLSVRCVRHLRFSGAEQDPRDVPVVLAVDAGDVLTLSVRDL